jgi:mannosyltransferase OCH1-like enzyme
MFILLIICSLFQSRTNISIVEQFYKNPTHDIPKLDVYKELDKNAKISRIIHQTAPSDKSKWHPIWEHCQESWKRNFPTYEYKMWNDNDIDKLIKNNYNWFYKTYIGYKHNINRVDVARYFYLYEYGGIYADMDFECLKNFEHLLPRGKACIGESPHNPGSGQHENALMCSPPKHPFWLCLILDLYEHRESTNVTQATLIPIDKTIRENKDISFTLESSLFSPVHTEEFGVLSVSGNNQEAVRRNINAKTDAYTRHHGTGVWFQK